MTSIPNFDNKEFPMREGKSVIERESVCVIVYKQETDQILCLKWADNSWKTFVNGGTEGLPVQEAALIEIREETGYRNVTFVAEVGKTRATFFPEKLFKLKDLMNTNTGKKIAEGRHKVMQEFYNQFLQEWEGKC